MGANQSSRKITVVNDEATGVIKISDAVVQRLKGEIAGGESKGEPAAPSAPPPAAAEPPPPPPPEPEAVTPAPLPPQEPTPPPPPPPAAEELPPPPAAAPDPPPPPAAAPPPAEEPGQQRPCCNASHVWQRPIIQYIEEPSLSALKVKQDKEEELKHLEDYWRDRLQKQQDEHTSMSKLSEAEFNKSLKTVETLFAVAGTGSVCRDESEAVRGCYAQHTKQSLRCGSSVNNFVNCVASARLG